jgi:uncharacterized protein YacL
MTSEKLFEFWKPLLLGVFAIPISFAITLWNVKAGTWFLGLVLKSELVGLLSFGVYFTMLGFAGIASFWLDIEKLKVWIQLFSIPKWMGGIAGTLMGISLAALCKNSGLSASGFLISACVFVAMAGVIRNFENQVMSKSVNTPKLLRVAVLASAAALLLGVGSFFMAWCKTCSCGV